MPVRATFQRLQLTSAVRPALVNSVELGLVDSRDFVAIHGYADPPWRAQQDGEQRILGHLPLHGSPRDASSAAGGPHHLVEKALEGALQIVAASGVHG